MGVGLSSRKGGRGWYIDNNILKECEAGNYCPLNETLGYYDRMTACADGEVCYNKVHEPYKCSWFHVCNGKVSRPAPMATYTVTPLYSTSPMANTLTQPNTRPCWRAPAARS